MVWSKTEMRWSKACFPTISRFQLLASHGNRFSLREGRMFCERRESISAIIHGAHRVFVLTSKVDIVILRLNYRRVCQGGARM